MQYQTKNVIFLKGFAYVIFFCVYNITNVLPSTFSAHAAAVRFFKTKGFIRNHLLSLFLAQRRLSVNTCPMNEPVGESSFITPSINGGVIVISYNLIGFCFLTWDFSLSPGCQLLRRRNIWVYV